MKLHGLPSEQLAPLLLALWDALISIADDLASSASAILSLLSQLNTERRAFELMAIAGLDVRTLVARLYPFFRHVITDVRRAVIANIRLLLRQSDLSWVDGILLSFLVQNIIVEQKSDLVRVSGEALSDCIGAVKIRDTDFIGWLKHAVFNPSMNWMAILATPPAAPLNVELFVRISQRGEPAHDIDKAAMRQDMSLISEESLIDGRVLVLRVLARVLQDFDGDVSNSHLFSPLDVSRAYSVSQNLAGNVPNAQSAITQRFPYQHVSYPPSIHRKRRSSQSWSTSLRGMS